MRGTDISNRDEKAGHPLAFPANRNYVCLLYGYIGQIKWTGREMTETSSAGS